MKPVVGQTIYRVDFNYGRNPEPVYTEYKVTKLTPEGFWYFDPSLYSIQKEWASFRTKKVWATKEKAFESLLARKRANYRHCKARLDAAAIEWRIVSGKEELPEERWFPAIAMED